MKFVSLTKLTTYLACGMLTILAEHNRCNSQAPAQEQAVAQSEIKPAPPTPIAVQKEALGKPGWDPAWDAIIEKALPAEFLTSSKVAKDVKPFCPHYSDMPVADRRAFWAYFFQALAGAEAGLEPTVTARHPQPEVSIVDPVTKRIARTEGLLQLAYMDSDRYGCDFDWERDKNLPVKDPNKTILQPETNLLCGMKILTNQVITQNKPLVTHTSYWSTLQPGTVSYRNFRRQMTNPPEACRNPRPDMNEADSTDNNPSPAQMPAAAFRSTQ
jgi:hypothetical protein